MTIFKRSSRVRFIVRATIFATLALSGCKARNTDFTLRGLTIDQSSKEIDYDRLFSKDSITITQIVAYESSYYRRPAGNGSSDVGVAAAFKMVWWLKNEARTKLFQGRMVVEADEFPESGRQVSLDKIYRFSAKVDGLAVKTASGRRNIKAQINVILGPSISPSRGMEMPEKFRSELVRAFVNDDIVSYNGHIWTTESQAQTSPFIAAPIDENTKELAAAIRDAGGRKSYGLIYMNACHGEKIENELMDAMIGKENDKSAEPILLSHRNYSNYGYFADHSAKLMVNLFNSKPLANVIFDMTTTLKNSKQALGGKVNDEDPAQMLQRYYNTPGVRENPRSVIIVAYDVIRKQAFQPSKVD